MKQPFLIAVIGGRKAGRSLRKEAEEVGRLIALNGSVLVSGGLHGIMASASKGAKKLADSQSAYCRRTTRETQTLMSM